MEYLFLAFNLFAQFFFCRHIGHILCSKELIIIMQYGETRHISVRLGAQDNTYSGVVLHICSAASRMYHARAPISFTRNKARK